MKQMIRYVTIGMTHSGIAQIGHTWVIVGA